MMRGNNGSLRLGEIFRQITVFELLFRRGSRQRSGLAAAYGLTIFLLRGLLRASLILSEATRVEELARGETGS
jgi:hypothetical protein